MRVKCNGCFLARCGIGKMYFVRSSKGNCYVYVYNYGSIGYSDRAYEVINCRITDSVWIETNVVFVSHDTIYLFFSVLGGGSVLQHVYCFHISIYITAWKIFREESHILSSPASWGQHIVSLSSINPLTFACDWRNSAK